MALKTCILLQECLLEGNAYLAPGVSYRKYGRILRVKAIIKNWDITKGLKVSLVAFVLVLTDFDRLSLNRFMEFSRGSSDLFGGIIKKDSILHLKSFK